MLFRSTASSRMTATPLATRQGATRDPRGAEAVSGTPANGAASEDIRAAEQGAISPPPMKPYRGPLTTLGNAATAKVRLIVWCRDCQHRIEPDPAEHAARYGAELPVIDWVKRLKCSQCGSRSVDFVLTGARR